VTQRLIASCCPIPENDATRRDEHVPLGFIRNGAKLADSEKEVDEAFKAFEGQEGDTYTKVDRANHARIMRHLNDKIAKEKGNKRLLNKMQRDLDKVNAKYKKEKEKSNSNTEFTQAKFKLNPVQFSGAGGKDEYIIFRNYWTQLFKERSIKPEEQL